MLSQQTQAPMIPTENRNLDAGEIPLTSPEPNEKRHCTAVSLTLFTLLATIESNRFCIVAHVHQA